MSAAQDALRLTAEAIVEAAALDGERTAVDATVRDRPGLGATAWLDLTIGGWHARASAAGHAPDDAAWACLRALDATLTRPDATTRRVREALSAALEREVQP